MTKQQFLQKINGTSLAQYADKFESVMKNTIRIKPTSKKEGEIEIGASKFGGNPALPRGTEWPTMKNGGRLLFVAQINLAEVAQYDVDNLLPKTGILYFFEGSWEMEWGNRPEANDKFKVIYYDGPTENLQRLLYPKELQVDRGPYHSCEITYSAEISLPCWDDPAIGFIHEDDIDAFGEIYNEIGDFHKMLGYPDVVQNSMELPCEIVTQEFQSGKHELRRSTNPADWERARAQWKLLLQVESNDEGPMMWGDMGTIYYWIKDIDLKERRFENSWLMIQCY